MTTPTLVAVLAGPAVQADLGAVAAAVVVSELVGARAAQVVALGAVVVRVADEAVRVDELRVARRVVRVVPVRARVRRPLHRQPRDQLTLAPCSPQK